MRGIMTAPLAVSSAQTRLCHNRVTHNNPDRLTLNKSACCFNASSLSVRSGRAGRSVRLKVEARFFKPVHLGSQSPDFRIQFIDFVVVAFLYFAGIVLK
jgi:hypothetical protein